MLLFSQDLGRFHLRVITDSGVSTTAPWVEESMMNMMIKFFHRRSVRRFLEWWVPIIVSMFYFSVAWSAPRIEGFGFFSTRIGFAVPWMLGASAGLGWLTFRRNPNVVTVSMAYMASLAFVRFLTIVIHPSLRSSNRSELLAWLSFSYLLLFWVVVITLLIVGALLTIASTTIDKLRDDDGFQ